ncbi:hypothetical protein [Mammaliicoccus phage vB_MscM-PMS3]|nr:hypothetical protein [Mammaliicoccus phage vB_MscM-PMS3]WBF82163.1 hypothetical protein [Mammaliicoccus virus vB_MscM-PMS2]
MARKQVVRAQDNEQKDTSKQETVKQEKKQISPKYIHIDTFIETAQIHFNLSNAQVAGFKAFMYGKYYQHKDTDFIPYLEKYLGKKLI